jgi:hypothetical protein
LRFSGKNRGGGSNSIGSGEEESSLAALGIATWKCDVKDNSGDDQISLFTFRLASLT